MKKTLFFLLLTTSMSMATQGLMEDDFEAPRTRQHPGAEQTSNRIDWVNALAHSENVSDWARRVLELPAVQEWILNDKKSLFKDLSPKQRFDKALALNYNQVYNLESEAVNTILLEDKHGLFKDLSPKQRFDKALGLSCHQRYTLEIKAVNTIILEDKQGLFKDLSPRQRFEKALGLSWEHRHILQSEAVNTIILEDKHGAFNDLSPRQRFDKAMGLSSSKRYTLESKAVNTIILEDKHGAFKNLSPKQRFDKALALTYCQRYTLERKAVNIILLEDKYGLFKDLSPKQRFDKALGLSWEQIISLKSEAVNTIILEDKHGAFKDLSPKQRFDKALDMTYGQRNTLESEAVNTMLLEDKHGLFKDLSPRQRFDRALDLTCDQRDNIEADSVQNALKDNIFTFDQGINLSFDKRNALKDPETYLMLKEGRLSVRMFLRPDAYGQVNASQSTHTASVHKSVAESIERLRDRYHKHLKPAEKAVLLDQFRKDLDGVRHEHTGAALRCFDHLRHEIDDIKESRSGVTMDDLLVYIAKAMQDKSALFGTPEDARRAMVRGFYEIQRGYNLDDKGRDLGGKDSRICGAGSFNKMIEVLTGVHPDAEIILQTKETASRKLPCVVQEEARKYMAGLDRDTRHALSEKIQDSQRKDQALTDLYGAIQEAVKRRMLEEFDLLYTGPQDTAFQQLMAYGPDALDPEDLG